MDAFVVFNKGSGELRVVRCSPEVAQLQPRDESEGVLPFSDPVSGLTHWVENGVVAPRPEISGLTSVPAGTRVFVDDVDHGICNDGVVEIAADVPGTYRVRLEPPFPYQQFETDVTIP